MPAPDAGFSVTFTLNKFQPVTVPVQVIRNPGDFASPPTTIIDPNPVFAELQPAGAAAEGAQADAKPKKPKPPTARRRAGRPAPPRSPPRR